MVQSTHLGEGDEVARRRQLHPPGLRSILPQAQMTAAGVIVSEIPFKNLPGRPLPRGAIRSAPVSDTGGPGAKPGEAANFIVTPF